MARADATPPEDTRSWIGEARAAAAFLTRLPVGGDPAARAGRLAEAAWAFPVVGLAVGIGGGLAYVAASALGLPPALAAVLAVAAQVLMTGALHEDGAADVADGFGGGATRKAKLAIMRDSRLGAFGGIALVLLLAARLAALAAIADPGVVLAALAAAAALSRAGVVALMSWLPPARADGLGAEAGRPRGPNVITALVIAAAVALLALGAGTGGAAVIGAGLGAVAVGWLARRQIGGHTGDVLGACQQGAEVLCLVFIAAAAA